MHNFSTQAAKVVSILYTEAYIRQTKYIVMMTNDWSTIFVNFMTPGARDFMLSVTICHKVKMYYFFKNLLYS